VVDMESVCEIVEVVVAVSIVVEVVVEKEVA
jgi:hypothetical protein